MEYTEKSENLERTYSVYIDKEQLNTLLDDIVKFASYKTKGTFGLIKENYKDLPNGDNMFEDVEYMREITSEGPYSFVHDSYSIKGTKITSPKLAYIIKGILSGDTESFDDFLNYKNSEELIPIDERINNIDNEINNISNCEYKRKINKLKMFGQLFEANKEGRIFNTTLLRNYYNKANDYIELQLISEKRIKEGSRIKLRELKK